MPLIGCHHLSIHHFWLVTGSIFLPSTWARYTPARGSDRRLSPLQSLINPSVIRMPDAANENKAVTTPAGLSRPMFSPILARWTSSQMNCRSCAGRGANIRKVVYCNGNSNHCSNSGPFWEGESETLPARPGCPGAPRGPWAVIQPGAVVSRTNSARRISTARRNRRGGKQVD